MGAANLRETIDVGVCTFRRDSLSDTLRSLAAQQLPPNTRLRVIVADNDESDSRRIEIISAAEALKLDLIYVHAPARNISIARNFCLDAAESEWFVFIDDDEEAEPDWIEKLCANRENYDIIFGVSRAIYASDAPKWIVDADLHSNRITGNDAAWNGYTANVMLRLAFVKKAGLRFDPDLGLSGGEDTLFFFDAKQAAARFGYQPMAVVVEPTPATRASFRWLALRRFRSGQIHYLILKREHATARGSVLAAAKAIWCFGTAPFLAFMSSRSRSQALRGAMHLGVVAAALGKAPYLEYAQSKPRN